ncbi:MAG: threonine synthase [Leptospiraceae bacterium]|nr:threonine synthase [Leptospiraceae bacterium]
MVTNNTALAKPAGARAWLESIQGKRQYDINQVLYRCTQSGSLLNVAHDMDALRQTSAAEWRRLFDARMGRWDFPNASGIWSKREWVLPDIDPAHIITLQEGRSPLLEMPPLARELGLEQVWLKECGTSHTGSFKDLGMTVLVSHVNSLIARGLPIRAVACASTGDTSAALAAYASRAGIPTIVFLPAGKITTAQLIQPISNGAHVLSLDTDFDGCMRIVQEVTADQSIYLANSMNPLRIEGQKTVGIEIIQQLGWQLPDWMIIPGGNLGNVSALAAGLDMLLETGIINQKPRLAVAQAAHANPLYTSYQKGFADLEPMQAKTTLASAIQIGNPVSFPRAVDALQRYNGVVEEVSEAELAHAAALADRQGFFCCPHTGVALGALRKLTGKGVIPGGASVAVISTAHGLKFSEFKTAYHENRLDFDATYRTEVIRLPADVQAVQEALKPLLEERA